jgi:hypothetical protein
MLYPSGKCLKLQKKLHERRESILEGRLNSSREMYRGLASTAGYVQGTWFRWRGGLTAQGTRTGDLVLQREVCRELVPLEGRRNSSREMYRRFGSTAGDVQGTWFRGVSKQ